MEERIAPCPPDARCGWAGVVRREATVAQAGTQLTLRSANSVKKEGERPPVALTAAGEGEALVLVERLPDGTRCSYRLWGR